MNKKAITTTITFYLAPYSSYSPHLHPTSHFSQTPFDLKAAKMQWKTLALALAMSAEDVYGALAEEKRQDSAALMRFECSKLAIERIDPLVQPSQAPPAHLVRICSNISHFLSTLVRLGLLSAHQEQPY
jgi:hypothetical protein